jgi:hypothetical protein
LNNFRFYAKISSENSTQKPYKHGKEVARKGMFFFKQMTTFFEGYEQEWKFMTFMHKEW